MPITKYDTQSDNHIELQKTYFDFVTNTIDLNLNFCFFLKCMYRFHNHVRKQQNHSINRNKYLIFKLSICKAESLTIYIFKCQ